MNHPALKDELMHSWRTCIVAACAALLTACFQDPGSSEGGTDGDDTGSSSGVDDTGSTTGDDTDDTGSTGETDDTGSTGETDGEPVCGNMILEDGEECDDSNQSACDSCDACERRGVVRFDGEDGQYLEAQDVDGPPLALEGHAFTVEAWVQLGADDAFWLGRRAPGDAGWRLWAADRLTGTIWGSTEVTVQINLRDDQWHHVAWTYELSGSRLYLDGALVAETAGPTTEIPSSDAPMRLNGASDADGLLTTYYSGTVDEARVSSVVRYIDGFDPEHRHESDAGTVGLWHFDEADGELAEDVSSNEHFTSAFGAVWMDGDGHGQLACD